MHFFSRVVFIMFLGLTVSFFPAVADAEKIQTFESDIVISPKNEAVVTEKIQYDFEGAEKRHGIYRDIPRIYTTTEFCNSNPQIDPASCTKEVLHPIRVLSVTDDAGASQPFTLEESTREWVRIKIGDPDKTISGTHTYVITYTFSVPVIKDKTTNQMLFAWDVTGDGWGVPMQQVSARVLFADLQAHQILKTHCFTGTLSFSTDDCEISTADAAVKAQINEPLPANTGFTLNAFVEPAAIVEGGFLNMTIDTTQCFLGDCIFDPTLQIQSAGQNEHVQYPAIGFLRDAFIALPAGRYDVTATEYAYQPVTQTIEIAPNQTQTLPVQFIKSPLWKFVGLHFPWISAALYLLLVIGVWAQYGRDPRLSKVVVTEFTPPKDLSPMEAGFVLDSTSKKQHLTAQVIDLAIRGYLTIDQSLQTGMQRYVQKGAYNYSYTAQVTRITEDWHTSKLSVVDKELLTAFFGENGITKTTVSLLDLKTTFHTHLTTVHKEVLQSMKAKKYITHSPKTMIYTSQAVVLLWILFSIVGSQLLDSWLYIVFGIPAGIVGLIFSFLMGKRTMKGTQMLRYLQGYQKYLAVAEKDRIAFFNDPKKYQSLFEQVLPYAIILGVEKQWCKQFDGLITEPPSWYNGNFTGIIMVSALTNDFGSALSAVSHAPSSGAGGIGGAVGGGFGGGGGGSW